MKSDGRRLQIAAAIACAFTVMWMVGLSETGTAFNGPAGAPAPILYQLAEGANVPASLIQKAIRAVPLLNDEVGGPVAFFGAATILWLWMFAWVPYLRKRRNLPHTGIKLSIFCCAAMAAICFYRLTDIDALRTFPSLISTAGIVNAIVASNALLWHFTLLWALFLTGSAAVAIKRLMTARVVVEVDQQAKRERRDRRTARQERKRKHTVQRAKSSR